MEVAYSPSICLHLSMSFRPVAARTATVVACTRAASFYLYLPLSPSLSLSCSLSLSHLRSLSLSLSHSRALSLSRSRSLSRALTLTRALPLALSLSLVLSLSRSLSRVPPLSLTHTRALSRSQECAGDEAPFLEFIQRVCKVILSFMGLEFGRGEDREKETREERETERL